MKELKYIKEFIVLSNLRNYAQAADLLYISQSTLSKHIMSLEESIGHPLFTRTTRRVELTEFGTLFLPYAIALQDAIDNCNSFIAASGRDSCTVTVGALRSLSLYPDIADSLNAFPKIFPKYKLNILQDSRDLLLERLVKRECDLIIVRESKGYETSTYPHVTIYTDPLCIMLPKDHPLANNDSLSLTAIAKESFILPPEGATVYNMFVGECRKAGFSPTINYRISSREYAAQLVRRHDGCAILGQSIANIYTDNSLVVIPLQPNMYENINIVYEKYSYLSTAARCLLNHLKGNELELLSTTEMTL